MIFEDRFHAGELLSKKLSKLKLKKNQSIVVAIPRGGVVVGAVIAQRLGIDVVPLVIKKLSAPFNSELAIGATVSFGKPVLDRWLIEELKVSSDYLRKEIVKKKKEARRRENYLKLSFSPNEFTGKTVIVVDDGMATGQTVKAAAKILRGLGVKELILGVPCASPQALDLVKADFGKIVCLESSPNFMAVGQFYRDFRPVDDLEVKQLLSQLTISH